MSRVGKMTIEVPAGVEVKIDGQHVSVKGPKGQLELDLHPKVAIKQEKNEDGKEAINFTVANPEDKTEKSLWGLSQSLVANMVQGVTEGFSKQLEVIGVGYKVNLQGKKLVLDVGYSHPVEYELPAGIAASVEKMTITLSGADKQEVGQVAAEIRKIRKPEPYKGKGIKYADETIRRKAGKAVKSGS